MEEFLAQYSEIIAGGVAFVIGVAIKGGARDVILKILKYATLILPVFEMISKKIKPPE